MRSVAKISEEKASSGIVGEAMAGLLKFIEERRRGACRDDDGFETFEREVRQRFREAEREFVGEELARLDVTLPEVMIGGVRHRRVISGVGEYMTAAGPVPEAMAEAEAFVDANGHEALAERVRHVGDLIEGFQSPYGMELLATVHWVGKYEGASTQEQALAAVLGWNARKKALMAPEHVAAAWNRLEQSGWLN